MQNAASTASPAEYPSRLIADIAVGMILCVNVISLKLRPLQIRSSHLGRAQIWFSEACLIEDHLTCQAQPFDHTQMFIVLDEAAIAAGIPSSNADAGLVTDTSLTAETPQAADPV